ncbi:hypothetical protein GCM10009808_18820 [Microbacterium sediminicola]|uniref:Holin-X, holin superfamily III n=1 Tax=Microbacterium sediminicola TaxID=415210 RepID=A0ABN2IAB2_9MICO
MTAPGDFRDRANDSLFTLLGELPELIRNLVIAEVDAAKDWARKTGKDAGVGVVLVLIALFVLFWSVPVFGTFVIAGLSSWWPVWLSAIVVFGVLLVIAIIVALLGVLKFRKITRRTNPVQSIAKDFKEVRDDI